MSNWFETIVPNDQTWSQEQIKRVKTVFVNHDFNEEDRELIKTVLTRGLGAQAQM